jgi:hypothetical protein
MIELPMSLLLGKNQGAHSFNLLVKASLSGS